MVLSRQLNDAQREAVTSTEGPLLVLAGAGTGKTRVITYRIARLLENGVAPGHVLAVTFTNKAAREMRDRVLAVLGKKRLRGGPTICTFHRLGVILLREQAARAGRSVKFSIYDRGDCVGILRELLVELPPPDGPRDPELLQYEISASKSRGGGTEGVDAYLARLMRRYEQALVARDAFDLDDLICWPVKLLEDPALAGLYQERYRYILVDEYQDTNQAQYEFLRRLVGPARHICVVGDDDQSIYRFRGAQREKILHFRRDFPGARVVKLEENYRSTNAILRGAHAVIARSAKRHAKRLFSRLGEGDKIRYVEYEDPVAEAEGIVDEIHERRLFANDAKECIAVLLRSVHQARVFEERLRFRRIPYTLVGGKSWYDRKEIKDVLAYLRLVVNARDDAAFLRVVNFPRRGVGDKTLHALVAAARERGLGLGELIADARALDAFTPRLRETLGALAAQLAAARARTAAGHAADAAWSLIDQVGYRAAARELYPDQQTADLRLKAVDMVLASLRSFLRENPGDGLAGFLGRLALETEEEPGADRPREDVVLMTLHSAKGLEFPVVYIPGFEERILPHEKSIAEGDDAVEEERRLAYVGMTRAQRSLTLTCCATRPRGQDGSAAPARSRFFDDIPPEVLTEADALARDRPMAPEEGLAYFRRLRAAARGGGTPQSTPS